MYGLSLWLQTQSFLAKNYLSLLFRIRKGSPYQMMLVAKNVQCTVFVSVFTDFGNSTVLSVVLNYGWMGYNTAEMVDISNDYLRLQCHFFMQQPGNILQR